MDQTPPQPSKRPRSLRAGALRVAPEHHARARVQANFVHSVTEYDHRFWLATGLTGVAAGVGAIVMMAVLRTIQHLAFSYHHGTYSSAAAAHSDLRRLIVLLIGGLVAGVGYWFLRRVLGGTGGEPTRSVWTGTDNMNVPRTFATGVLQETFIGLGGSLGREAAPQHFGAAFGSYFSRHLSLPAEQRRLLIACGAGAGVGAVYNVPLAGALFATELYLGSITLTTVVPAVMCASIATLVGWITLPTHSVYQVSLPATPSASSIVFAALAGPLLGLATAAFVRLIGWANDHRPTGGPALIGLPVVAFGILGLLSFAYPLLLGNGRDLAEFALLGGGTVGGLLMLGLLKPLVTGLALRSGPGGGLFTPTLSTGAALGACLGHAWMLLWPGTAPPIFAMIGAAAMLAAGMQAPIAGIVFAVELTNSISASLVPILIAVAGAVIVARGLDPRSIYSARLPQPVAAAEEVAVPADSGIAETEPVDPTVVREPAASGS
ncbi:chloride channel protein [Conexibacter sp. DBS9H8]|uniref:chloride channel protein n=1 Tax=Conexibacter sp. DBS9H8 TaxID=2937801 RepID=UPI00200DD579|nr:chloride channel protein [Conexibacter sp. DBS9H8]